MVKYKDINRAISLRLKEEYPEIGITSTDIEEGFDRPSFFIDFRNVKATDFMDVAIDREINVVIYYFPEDMHKNKVDLLDKRDGFESIFLENNIMTIDENTNVEIESLEMQIVDKVLNCSFDLKLTERYDREDTQPVMEDLEFKA